MFLDLSILSCVNSIIGIIGTRWLNMAELVPTLNSKDALNESVCLSPTGGQQLRLFLCIWVHCFEWNHEINQSLDPHNILSEAEVPEQMFQAWALVGMHGFHTFAELLWAGLFVLGQNSDDGRTSCKLQRTWQVEQTVSDTAYFFGLFLVLILSITSCRWLNEYAINGVHWVNLDSKDSEDLPSALCGADAWLRCRQDSLRGINGIWVCWEMDGGFAIQQKGNLNGEILITHDHPFFWKRILEDVGATRWWGWHAACGCLSHLEPLQGRIETQARNKKQDSCNVDAKSEACLADTSHQNQIWTQTSTRCSWCSKHAHQ